MKKGSPDKTGALSPKRRKILEEFKYSLEFALQNGDCTFEEIKSFIKEAPDEMNKIFNDYEKAIFKAIRSNFHNHSLNPIKTDRSLLFSWRGNPTHLRDLLDVRAICLEWIYTHRALGNKGLLRKARRGFEVGAKRPLKMEQAELKNVVEELRLREIEVDTVSDMDDNDVSTLGEILQKDKLTRIYDRDNPPPHSKKPRPWTEVYNVLFKRGIVKTTRQVFLRKIKRLSPSLFPRPKEPKDQSKKE